MRANNIFKIMLSVVVLFMFGCTHTLEVPNLSSYRSTQITSIKNHKTTVGMICNSSDPVEKRLVKGVATSLNSQCDVILPYSANSTREVDYVAIVNFGSEYQGSGWNFLVNWPGFLVFAPAWNGYVYNANYKVDVSLQKGPDKKPIDAFSLPIKLDIRHANYNRTWTELSWFEVSAIAFLGGIWFTQYDDSVTPLLVDKIESPVGEYIAQDIINRISAQEK